MTQLDVVRVVQPAVPNSTMSGDGTMLENCWASLVIALLEKEENSARAGEDAGAQMPHPLSAECGSPCASVQGFQQDADPPATASPKCKKMATSPGEMEETCGLDSFLSETTAQAGRFRESPGMVETEQSFHTDGTSRVAFSSFSPEPSPQPRLRAGGPGSYASVAAAELARQHLEWAQELEQVDQRQADLMMTQWKLIRSQTGMLAQQLIDVRKELDQMKKEQQKSSQHFENQHLQSREMQTRLGTMLQQSVEETHMGMARIRSEVQRRASQESEFQQRVQSLESWTTTTFPKLESEVSELRSAVDVSMKQMTQLKDQLMQQVDEWKSGHAMVMEHSTKLHDRMRKGLRALMAAHETHRSEVEQSQKILRENLEQKLENQWQEVLRQFEDGCLYKEDGDLRNRIEDLEASIDPTLERHTQGLQLKCEELEQRCKELESGSKWMGATLSQEVNSRNAMVEVFEQMLKTETSKISSSVSDQIAVAHLDCKETQKTILDHLSKETAERQEQARGINGDLASLGNSLGDRLGRLEGAWHGVRQDWRESQSSFRSMQGQLRLLEDGLESGLQGLRSEMHSSLREERLKREVNGTSMAEQMQAWEEFHKHLRQFYMAHTALPPGDRLRDSEMDMARLAEMLRCSHDEGGRMGVAFEKPEGD